MANSFDYFFGYVEFAVSLEDRADSYCDLCEMYTSISGCSEH